MGTVVVGIIVAGVVALAVRSMVRDKKNGIYHPQAKGAWLQDYKTETDHPGYHPAGGLLLLQGNLLQSFRTRYKDWICNGLPYGEYVGRNRCHQQKEHVQSGM